ncbi:HD domain-containing protein [Metabacillus herbersteinensis]|uniref:HD domain-containing protein n=1 Tax=Metabacillus herbersteinensis TaxID=283816 RepID=A0ABV6GDD7_9BACI
MNKLEIIKTVENFVSQLLEKEGSGHDWWHIHRVRNMSLMIAKKEGADPFIVELSALLHDVIDDKLSDSIKMKPEDVEQLLEDLQVENVHIKEIIRIITSISFRKRMEVPLKTLEAKVVQDADRLDAIGAIGIARTFTYAGSKGHLIYEPKDFSYKPNDKKSGSAIDHFYEKLLNLKNLMNTSTAKEMAEERHRLMEDYLKNFYHEWNVSGTKAQAPWSAPTSIRRFK